MAKWENLFLAENTKFLNRDIFLFVFDVGLEKELRNTTVTIFRNKKLSENFREQMKHMIISKLLFLPSIPRTSTQSHQTFVKQYRIQSTTLSPGAERGGGERRSEKGEEEKKQSLYHCISKVWLVGNRHMNQGTSQLPGKQERESYCQTGASGMIFSGSMT